MGLLVHIYEYPNIEVKEVETGERGEEISLTKRFRNDYTSVIERKNCVLINLK